MRDEVFLVFRFSDDGVFAEDEPAALGGASEEGNGWVLVEFGGRLGFEVYGAFCTQVVYWKTRFSPVRRDIDVQRVSKDEVDKRKIR